MAFSGKLTLERPPPGQLLPVAPARQPRFAVVTAGSVQIKVPLKAEEVATALQPFASATTRIAMVIRLNGWRLNATLTPKAVRKVLATLREHGMKDVAVLVQGRLGHGDEILEPGLIAQPMKPKSKQAG